jgi:hypothetical protein
MKLKLRAGLLIVSYVAIVNCGTVKVYDHEWCADLGAYGAHCNHTLVDKPRNLSKVAWNNERVGWLCTSSVGFNDTQTTIDQFCARYKNVCDYRSRGQLQKGLVRIKRLVQKGLEAKQSQIELSDLEQNELDLILQETK